MIKSDSVVNLTKALLAAQKKFSPVLKSKDNPFFKSKYADLAAAIDATQDALIENGLVVSQFPVNDPTRVGVLTLLVHTSGEFIGQEYTLPMVKQDAQTGVAAVTYARRAAYLGVLGIAAEDDDGNTAAGRYDDDAPEPASRPRRQVSAAPAEDRGSRPQPVAGPEPADIPNEDAPQGQPVRKRVATPTIEMPTGGDLPDEQQLNEYRAKVVKLQNDLAAAGMKASRNMPINRKVLMYLLKTAGTDDATKITVQQWQTFFDFTDKMQGMENGISQLAKLINEAAK
jgi:ERF superfamily